jgi:hypothetical protein
VRKAGAKLICVNLAEFGSKDENLHRVVNPNKEGLPANRLLGATVLLPIRSPITAFPMVNRKEVTAAPIQTCVRARRLHNSQGVPSAVGGPVSSPSEFFHSFRGSSRPLSA